jgi:hypothetical protein
MTIGGKDLFDRSVADEVSRGRSTVPGHNNTIGVSNRNNSGGVGDLKALIDRRLRRYRRKALRLH